MIFLITSYLYAGCSLAWEQPCVRYVYNIFREIQLHYLEMFLSFWGEHMNIFLVSSIQWWTVFFFDLSIIPFKENKKYFFLANMSKDFFHGTILKPWWMKHMSTQHIRSYLFPIIGSCVEFNFFQITLLLRQYMLTIQNTRLY